MKVPEFMFVIINPVMRMLLHSPLHRIFSDSIMLITWTGRKSGKQFTTPVRYLREGKTICCFTLKENVWWRNLRDGEIVTLRLIKPLLSQTIPPVSGTGSSACSRPFRRMPSIRMYVLIRTGLRSPKIS